MIGDVLRILYKKLKTTPNNNGITDPPFEIRQQQMPQITNNLIDKKCAKRRGSLKETGVTIGLPPSSGRTQALNNFNPGIY